MFKPFELLSWGYILPDTEHYENSFIVYYYQKTDRWTTTSNIG